MEGLGRDAPSELVRELVGHVEAPFGRVDGSAPRIWGEGPRSLKEAKGMKGRRGKKYNPLGKRSDFAPRV